MKVGRLNKAALLAGPVRHGTVRGGTMQITESERNLLRTFLASLIKLQNVDRGSVWVKRKGSYHCLEALGSQSEKVRGMEISVSKPSVVGWVIENEKMTIAKPGEDDRHLCEIEEDLDVKSTLILCFPLIMKNGDVYGVIQLIDTSAMGSKVNLKKEYLELIENLVTVGSIALSNFLDYHIQLEENQKLNQTLNQLRNDNPMIGKDRSFLDVVEKARDYARVEFPVLIMGESGSGKELLAREIYRLSGRKEEPFLVQNCSAIPPALLESELFGHKKGAFTGASRDRIGLFEAAGGGTVFLDEIGDMPLDLQARILRVIQDGEIKPLGGVETKRVDVRIISATHVDLSQAVAQKSFREDLFYRLNVLPLNVPPLRERKEDIPLLLDYFLNRECYRLGIQPKRISEEALSYLVAYPWKGNVRELENLVKFMIVAAQGNTINETHMPDNIIKGKSAVPAALPVRVGPEDVKSEDGKDSPEREPGFAGYNWQELEKDYILYLLEENRWNITRAAQKAGIKRSTFDSRMRKLGIRKNS
jgi:transcriptional regulator with GAF, ATPase, and Fis domain